MATELLRFFSLRSVITVGKTVDGYYDMVFVSQIIKQFILSRFRNHGQ